MKPTPLMIISDSPDQCTGLSRICRNLATNMTSLPDYRICTFGRGGFGTNKLPFMQYNFDEAYQWGETIIERCWEDFAGSEKGIIFTIWDATRLSWFGMPQYWPQDSKVGRFLRSGRFERWGYFPVDSTGPGDRLSSLGADTLLGFDRVLGYSAWGAEVLSRTLGRKIDYLPHGINGDLFKIVDKKTARLTMGGKATEGASPIIGCVMTNQARKDWGLAFASIASLKKKYPNLLFWVHVDVMERYWSLPALIADFGLQDNILLTDWLSDEGIVCGYSACDFTILPSLGEGFGFPIAESLACGTPVIHGNYGGGAELIPHEEWLVDPAAFRMDTIHNCMRPVFEGSDWVMAMDALLKSPTKTPEECRSTVEHLFWMNLWPAWEKWFTGGTKLGEMVETHDPTS